jgi:hypothetical protein
METKQQEWLINYLVNHNFTVDNANELQKKISGMTASQIIEAMKIARDLQEKLGSTALGRELL